MNEKTTNPPTPALAVEPYISKKEVAARLQKDLRTVNNWMRLKQIPYYKVGRTVLFKWSEVEAVMQAKYGVSLHPAAPVRSEQSASQSLAE